MSPRPRKATGEQVFDAATRLMGRLGPSELTLAAIAEEAGVTPAALVQRFGSRRGLQLAVAERVTDQTPDLFAELRARHRAPLSAIPGYAACYAGMADDLEEILRPHLAEPPGWEAGIRAESGERERADRSLNRPAGHRLRPKAEGDGWVSGTIFDTTSSMRPHDAQRHGTGQGDHQASPVG